MAVVLGVGTFGAFAKIGTFNPAMLVHGEQAIELYGEIPVEGTVTTTGEITGIYDKGKGAVVVVESVSVDKASGQPLFKNTMSAFIRGEGGWGGDRGPSGPKNVPPEREPDHVVTYQTREDQALLYRLSGDRNPLRSVDSPARSFTACALTASPGGRCCTRCATAIRPDSSRWRGGSRHRCSLVRRLPSRCGSTATSASSRPAVTTAGWCSMPAAARSFESNQRSEPASEQP